MAIEKRRKVKTKRRDKTRNDAEPTKEEYAVAKYVRFNCPTKKANIMGNDLPYFAACKAIDCLMSSKFAGDGEKKIFSNRHSCVAYMQTLLDKGLFFRAKKLVPKTKDIKQLVAESKDQKGDDAAMAVKKRKKLPASEDDAQKKADEVVSTKTTDKDAAAKKKSKKVKFDVHQNQVFSDGNDIYVWKYDPTSTKMFFLGLAMVIGAIGVCLFPLWPLEVRLGVYYLSIAAMGFVGVIIALVVIRMVLFAAIWLCTLGRHHFWLLPHLTDDCGFFESFQPLYTHTKMQGKRKMSAEDDEQVEKDKSKKDSGEENAKNSGNDLEEEDDDDEEEEGEADDQGDKECPAQDSQSSAGEEDQLDSSAAEEVPGANTHSSSLPKNKHCKKSD